MEFVMLVISAALAGCVHWLVRRDFVAALAFGLALLAFGLVPALARLAGG